MTQEQSFGIIDHDAFHDLGQPLWPGNQENAPRCLGTYDARVPYEPYVQDNFTVDRLGFQALLMSQNKLTQFFNGIPKLKSLSEAEAVATQFLKLGPALLQEVLRGLSIHKAGVDLLSHYLVLRIRQPRLLSISEVWHLDALKVLQIVHGDLYEKVTRMKINEHFYRSEDCDKDTFIFLIAQSLTDAICKAIKYLKLECAAAFERRRGLLLGTMLLRFSTLSHLCMSFSGAQINSYFPSLSPYLSNLSSLRILDLTFYGPALSSLNSNQGHDLFPINMDLFCQDLAHIEELFIRGDDLLFPQLTIPYGGSRMSQSELRILRIAALEKFGNSTEGMMLALNKCTPFFEYIKFCFPRLEKVDLRSYFRFPVRAVLACTLGGQDLISGLNITVRETHARLLMSSLVQNFPKLTYLDVSFEHSAQVPALEHPAVTLKALSDRLEVLYFRTSRPSNYRLVTYLARRMHRLIKLCVFSTNGLSDSDALTAARDVQGGFRQVFEGEWGEFREREICLEFSSPIFFISKQFPLLRSMETSATELDSSSISLADTLILSDADD